MADSVPNNETRDEVLHAPNLFEFFCMRTADDMRLRGGKREDAPAVSFASLIISVLAAFAFYVFGKPQLAKAAFVIFGVLMLWTIWGVVVRSSEQISQKADSIKGGVFPPASAPFVFARLKWWNHLVTPLRWGKHSRLYDRRTKLEVRIEDLEKQIAETIGKANPPPAYAPPKEEEVIVLAEKITKFSERNEYETDMNKEAAGLPRLRAELLLDKALMHKLQEMSDKLERTEKLSVVFQNFNPNDLSQVVSEAIQLLEERRLLVLSLDQIDPEDFIDLVTVRVA